MIQIEVNRYTVQRLEECIERYNALNSGKCYHITTYLDFINRMLDEYLNENKTRTDECNRAHEIHKIVDEK